MVEAIEPFVLEFFSALPLQAPGTDEDTWAALKHIEHDLPPSPSVIDFGCGTGRSALALAHSLPAARILAIDSAASFVEKLAFAIATRNLSGRVRAAQADMMRPPVAAGSADLIWCESAVYFVGLTEALRRWRPLLRPGGHCVVSECEWLTDDRPGRVEAFWRASYPRMGNRAENLRRIGDAGYRVRGTHVMSERGWETYYGAIATRLGQTRPSSGSARFLEGLSEECSVYEGSNGSYGYVFYAVRPDE